MKFQLLIEIKILKNNDFSCLNHSDAVSILLGNVKMQTIVGILTFLNRINVMLSRASVLLNLLNSLQASHFISFPQLV